MIAWMYCVGEGWRSCEDATMSKSLPVTSLFCWFCKYEVHELVYFLTFRKNGIMLCFVLFCSFGNRSESFFIWMIHLFVFGTETLICQISALGWLVGGGMGGVNCEANHEPPRRTHHRWHPPSALRPRFARNRAPKRYPPNGLSATERPNGTHLMVWTKQSAQTVPT